MITPDQFMRIIVPQAQQVQRDTGISAGAMIAQAALESEWGRSGLTADANNLFGVKADHSWTGPTLKMPTREVIDGKAVKVDAIWRAYPDWHASIDDHARFLFENHRYAPALAVRDQPEEFCRQLQACGYATDPEYAELLIKVMHGRDMSQYDIPRTDWALLPWAQT